MKQPDGGPAFPVIKQPYAVHAVEHPLEVIATGMSLRDYFAAKALQSLIHLIGMPEDREKDELWNGAMAKDAYMLADAMLKARET